MLPEEIDNYYNKEYQLTNSLEKGREQTAKERFDTRIKTIAPIIEQIKPCLKKGQRVLDIGCGAGEVLYSIKLFVSEVVGVELNKSFVDHVKNDLGFEAYCQDVNLIDFKDKKFDLIISFGALDHMPNPLETLKTMKSLLAPGGELCLFLPNRNEAMNFFLPESTREKFNAFFWHKAHFFYFTKETSEKLLTKAGFTCEITNYHQYTLKNFLNWYFTGASTKLSVDAMSNVDLFSGNDPFEQKINEMFQEMERRFHKIAEETFRGDMIRVIAKPVSQSTEAQHKENSSCQTG